MACIERARAAGVSQILIPGLHAGQWTRARVLAAAHGLLYAVGTHPQLLVETREVPIDPGDASAIGECGLDAPTPVAMDEQIRVLEAHLALARETGLPVILHCVRAHAHLLGVLRRWAPVRGVLHSYSGGVALVPEYIAHGLHLSFAGPITWERARKPLQALKSVPIERLLLETDAPDQCPRPHRGRSEPAYLGFMVEAAERIRAEPLRAALSANARSLGWF